MIKLQIVDSDSGNWFDVSSLAHDINFTTSLMDQPGKLSFTLEKDPNNILKFTLGSIVIFDNDGEHIFYGYVFTIGTDRSDTYKVTAYDQLRYFQNHGHVLIRDMTLREVFEMACIRTQTVYEIPAGLKIPDEKLPERLFNDNSYFEILQWAINEANTQSGKGEDVQKFFIRDNFGTLQLNEIGFKMEKKYSNKLVAKEGFSFPETKSYLIIGDESLLTGYQYELSIDKDTYNEIEAVTEVKSDSSSSEDDTSGDRAQKNKKFLYSKQDKASVKKYGLLRKIVNVKSQQADTQLVTYVEKVLENFSQPSKTMKIDAIGVNGIDAGDGFVLKLKKLDIPLMKLYAVSASHNYNNGIHTMSLEVATSKLFTEVLG